MSHIMSNAVLIVRKLKPTRKAATKSLFRNGVFFPFCISFSSFFTFLPFPSNPTRESEGALKPTQRGLRSAHFKMYSEPRKSVNIWKLKRKRLLLNTYNEFIYCNLYIYLGVF